MFTPATAASSGSAPSRMSWTARSTALRPFELEIATGRAAPLVCALAMRVATAAAAAVPNSFLRLIVTAWLGATPLLRGARRRGERRRARPAPARVKRDRLEAFGAGLRGRLVLANEDLRQRENDPCDDDEVHDPAHEIPVLHHAHLCGAPIS